MAAITGRAGFGLFKNGQASSGTNKNFSGYSYTNADAMSGDGCFAMSGNVRGSGLLGDEYIKVDPKNNTYVLSVSLKTYQRSYNNRNGSGHLGFGCYDKNKNFISHYNIANNLGAQLTRAANPGDTVIYINRGDWRNVNGGGSGHTISLNFFPATQEDFDYERAPGRYSRVGIYSSAWSSITNMGGGEYRVNLNRGVPGGHLYPAGTWVYQTQSGGSYNYALGAPVYPETWTTYTTGLMTGFGDWSGAGFRWGTVYIKWLNLRNYNYRSESGGISAKYYLDNIMLYRVKPPTKEQKAAGHSHNPEVASNSFKEKFTKIKRFKRNRRGGQKRGDFF
jgi:hypothetical protein